jgi:integrase
MLRNWTGVWLQKNASELNRADAREVLLRAEDMGKTINFCKKLKTTINVVYNWAIEERLVVGQHQSPVKGIEAGVRTQEKMPEILSVEQIKKLLFEAKVRPHPWYPVWAFTVLTGCRSGEVHGLRREDQRRRRWVSIITKPRAQAFWNDSLAEILECSHKQVRAS